MHDEVQALTKMVATKLAKKWKIDRDDIAQEIYMWILMKLDTSFFDDYLDPDDHDGVVEYADKLRRFKSSIYWAGVRYCHQEKAAIEGYQPRDQVFYGIRQLQELLSAYLTTGIDPSPPKGRSDSVRRSIDASEGGGHLAGMIDIDRGLQKLPHDYRSRLEVRFGPLGDLSDEQVAGLSQSEIKDLTGWHHDHLRDVLGVTKDQIRHRTDTAVRALQRELGGLNPWRTEGYASVA